MCRHDDEIYDDFIKSFPEYASKDWDGVVDEDEMKSAEGKKRWREFMMRYEKKVGPFTLSSANFRWIRIISEVFYGYPLKWNTRRRLRFLVLSHYGEESCWSEVPRMQFLAIELGRNRLKLNDWIHEESKKETAMKSWLLWYTLSCYIL